MARASSWYNDGQIFLKGLFLSLCIVVLGWVGNVETWGFETRLGYGKPIFVLFILVCIDCPDIIIIPLLEYVLMCLVFPPSWYFGYRRHFNKQEVREYFSLLSDLESILLVQVENYYNFNICVNVFKVSCVKSYFLLWHPPM